MTSNAAPDFSIIKFVKHKSDNFVNLLNFFDAVVKHEGISIGDVELEQILYKDLDIDFNTIESNLKLVLVESLLYYMTVWPGWKRFQEYSIGQLSHQDWFLRFRQYLIFKTRFVINSALVYTPEKLNKTDAPTQTDNDINQKKKAFAPYGVCISGPVSVLNNIVFIKSKEDILVKQYPTKEWQHLKLSEFYNWPNVSVELNLPDISLSRTIAHQTHRYMSLSGDMVIVPEVDHIIYVKKLLEAKEPRSFTYDFIKCYFLHLNHILRKIPGINNDRILELQALLSEFLQDILEVNLCQKTICTNMAVGYNMGKSRYVRSRKMVKSQERNESEEIINFYELVIPQVDITLHSFHAQQDYSDHTNITFKSLNKLELRMKNNEQEVDRVRNLIHNCIIYKCNVCCETFIGHSARGLIIKHFALVHTGEQSVLCYKCHRELSIQQLAGMRWKHSCNT